MWAARRGGSTSAPLLRASVGQNPKTAIGGRRGSARPLPLPPAISAPF